MRIDIRRAVLASAAGTLVALAVAAAPALANSPWWLLSSMARPTYLPSQPGETGEIAVFAENVGDAPVNASPTSGQPVVISDALPAGLEAIEIGGSAPGAEYALGYQRAMPCSVATLSCNFEGSLVPYSMLEVRVKVRVKAGAHTGEQNQVEVTGGGAPTASVARQLTFSSDPTPFGVEEFRNRFEEEGGGPDARAGSHPFQMTTVVALNQGSDEQPAENKAHQPRVEPVGLAKDVFTKFPVGFIGDPTPIPTCSMLQFLTFRVTAPAGENQEQNSCPAESAVGIATVRIWEPLFLDYAAFTVPLFELEPEFGEPARFGFAVIIGDVPVVLDASLRSGAGEGALPGEGEDYGINVDSSDITQTAGLISVTVTVWGTPGDPRHDASRGWSCLYESYETDHAPCLHPESKRPPALLTLPTSCSGPLKQSVEVDSWAQPGAFQDYLPWEPPTTLVGCNRLAFGPSVQATPTTRSVSSPTGLDVNLDFHDEGLTNSEGLTQSRLKDTVVTLPEGLTVNPSSGVGLVGCTTADFARETLTSIPGAGCPDESKLGTVEIATPVLAAPIHGSLFIAQPHENQFGSLLALYIVARNPETGIFIKLAGKVTPNPVTGQLVTTFENNPQLPFSHFNFHFREGQQAPLITPPTCGMYTTQAELTPWANPLSPIVESTSFEITSGVGGGSCPTGPPPFNPQISSGTKNNNAGGFSEFDLRLTRGDADQEISTFSTSLPPGLVGVLAGIPFCPDADIALARTRTGLAEEANPSCPAASEVGHTLVGTGVGSVLAYTPGKIYLAGPYHGDPFSLVSVTSAVVGPFDLGTVVIRFGLRIDPHTAQVGVDPSTSEPIPHIIDGIVTHVRDIRVYVDRSKFTVNPTNCERMAISSTLGANLGQSTTISSPFQATNCASLKFAPKFSVSTTAHASRLDGASLHVRLAYPSGSMGSQANIGSVKVELPKALPSRLTTLQKACTAEAFEANPASCPRESMIGRAVVHTQLLPVPLEGPAYFVSNGGEAFPNLILVLHGYGVTVDLVGDTLIKDGVTSTTFKSTPDVPFETFELTLPQGEYSALAANGDLCRQKLTMPTAFVAQNGATLNQNTPIQVQGCPNALAVKSKRVTGRTVALTVWVPAAGHLTAGGKGLTAATRASHAREPLTLVLHARRRGRFASKIRLTFTPSTGKDRKKLTKAVPAKI
jgi:hypothetical protein